MGLLLASTCRQRLELSSIEVESAILKTLSHYIPIGIALARVVIGDCLRTKSEASGRSYQLLLILLICSSHPIDERGVLKFVGITT